MRVACEQASKTSEASVECSRIQFPDGRCYYQSMISLGIDATRGHYIGVRRCWPSHSRETRASSLQPHGGTHEMWQCPGLLPPLSINLWLFYIAIIHFAREWSTHRSALEKGSPGTCPQEKSCQDSRRSHGRHLCLISAISTAYTNWNSGHGHGSNRVLTAKSRVSREINRCCRCPAT